MTTFVSITNVVKNSMLLSPKSLFSELLILSLRKRAVSRLRKQSFNLVTKRWVGAAHGQQLMSPLSPGSNLTFSLKTTLTTLLNIINYACMDTPYPFLYCSSCTMLYLFFYSTFFPIILYQPSANFL